MQNLLLEKLMESDGVTVVYTDDKHRVISAEAGSFIGLDEIGADSADKGFRIILDTTDINIYDDMDMEFDEDNDEFIFDSRIHIGV